MHRAKQAWQWLRSSMEKMWQEAHPTIKVASLLKKVNPQQSDGLIPTLAFLPGAVAFGLWQQSFAAALFAGVALFLLAGIYHKTERMLAVLRRPEYGPHLVDISARAIAEQTSDSGALKQAIGCLKPWLASEVSLTEENARECCAVLLDSVAGKARSASNNF
jgi:hypothetical protein